MEESQSEDRKGALLGAGGYGPGFEEEYESSSSEMSDDGEETIQKHETMQPVNARAFKSLFGSIRVDPLQPRVYETHEDEEESTNSWPLIADTNAYTDYDEDDGAVFEYFDTNFDFLDDTNLHKDAKIVAEPTHHHTFEYDSSSHHSQDEIESDEAGIEGKSDTEAQTGTASRQNEGASWWDILYEEQGDFEDQGEPDTYIRALKMSGVGDAADVSHPTAKSTTLGENYPSQEVKFTPRNVDTRGSLRESGRAKSPFEKPANEKKQRIRFKGVTSHPSTKASFFSGPSVAAFVHKFRDLPKERCHRWFLRAKEMLDILWDEARVDNRDRQLFFNSHCTGGFTISKAVAVAMHIQLLTVQLSSRKFANWLIMHRNNTIYSLKKTLVKYERAKMRRKEELERKKAPLLGFDVQWNDQKTNMQIEVRALLLAIAKLTVQIVEQVTKWRRTLWRPQPFLYNGKNYMKQMTRDICFLDKDPAKTILRDMKILQDEIDVVTAFSCIKYGIPRRTTETHDEQIRRERTRRKKLAEHRSEYYNRMAEVHKNKAIDDLHQRKGRPCELDNSESAATVESEANIEFPSPNEELPEEKEMLDAPRSILDAWASSTLLPDPNMIHRVDHAISILAMERDVQSKLKAEAMLLAEKNMFIPCLRWRLPPRKDCIEVPIDLFEKHPEDMSPSSEVLPSDYGREKPTGAYGPVDEKTESKEPVWTFPEDYYTFDEAYAVANDIYTAEMDEVAGGNTPE